ncbi:MAG: hypothetical protein LBL59_05630 [Xanthomonadaceae bacterium]|jgi:hypothetical protein|nr:hypothetical protein [Xanthomonadaceae bacterium]
MKAMRCAERRACPWYARRACQACIVDVIENLPAQRAEQSMSARLDAQVGITYAGGVGEQFHADEPQHAVFHCVTDNEPAMAWPVGQWIASAIATYRGTGEKAPHLGEECRFVIE